MKYIKIIALVIAGTLVISFVPQPALAQVAENWTVLGYVQPKNINQIKSANWLVGCETLDRDYADYDAYKTYLAPLGIKKIRLQAGWAKIERIKGTYDFSWLDHIIADAQSRGLTPWLQFSYGNPIYAGGGGANLSAGLPQSEEALTAWDNWVKATTEHYKDKVSEWEVWNEPNNIPENTPQQFAGLTARTVRIIKHIQPRARISALALGGINLEFAEQCLLLLAQQHILELVDNITYHGYSKNPDSHYGDVEKLRTIVSRYGQHLKLRQGENGAPSRGNMGGAISDYNWTELSQAKWDTRRMLGDLGRDIESSVFTIVDIAYNTDGPIKKLNVKGLLASDSTKKVTGIKQAYRAVQHVTAIFDDHLERISDLSYTASAADSISVFGYKNKLSGKSVLTIWQNSHIPANNNPTKKIDITLLRGNFSRPVLVDIISGKVYEIPASQWNRDGNTYRFYQLPVYDGPVLIADRSLVSLTK